MIKLFCIPGGGASATAFLPWMKYLDRDIKLCMLEIAGRGLRHKENIIEDMDLVADDLYGKLLEQLDQENDKYMIIGYCFGAVAGYEIYRRLLHGNNKLPFHMFFCASDPPNGNTYATSLFSDRNRSEEIEDVLTRYFPPHVFKDREEIDKFCSMFTEKCYENYEKYGKIIAVLPEEVFESYSERKDELYEKVKSLEFANQTMRILDVDQNIVQVYQTEPREHFKITTDITVFAGERDTMTELKEVKKWDYFAGKGFKLEVIDGGHLILIDGYQHCIPIINAIAKQKAGD